MNTLWKNYYSKRTILHNHILEITNSSLTRNSQKMVRLLCYMYSNYVNFDINFHDRNQNMDSKSKTTFTQEGQLKAITDSVFYGSHFSLI